MMPGLGPPGPGPGGSWGSESLSRSQQSRECLFVLSWGGGRYTIIPSIVNCPKATDWFTN